MALTNIAPRWSLCPSCKHQDTDDCIDCTFLVGTPSIQNNLFHHYNFEPEEKEYSISEINPSDS